MLRRLRPALPFIVFSLLIFSTIDIGRALEKWLTGTFGPGIFNTVYLLVGAALAFAFWRILYGVRREWWRAAGLLALAGLYIPLLVNLKFSVEKVHYIEYGILALLAARPLARSCRLLPALFLSLCAVYLVGLLDEFFQHVHPQRVGEWRDAGINLTAGALALCGFAITAEKAPPFTAAVAPLPAAAFLAVAATWAFLEQVHGFGGRIALSPTVAFNSGLDSSALKETDARLSRNEPAGEKPNGIYLDEARRHLFQRDYYAGDWKSFNENLILESCYGHFLSHQATAWDSLTRGKAEKNAGALKGTPWHSRVNERMIVRVKAPVARGAFLAVLLCLVLTGGRRKRKRLPA